MTTVEYRFNRCPICKADIRDRAEGEGCKNCLASEDEMNETARTPYEAPVKQVKMCDECGNNDAKYMRGSRMVCEGCK